MSTILLLKSTLEQLDRVSRTFLWGGTLEKRKHHLVAWKRICLPKSEGGLGVRSSLEMNKALLAKLGWRVLHDKVSLWARVLRSKYKIGDVHDMSWLVVKSTWSSTWRSVGVGLREGVIPGLSWVIGDGKQIRFWMDKWLFNKPLSEVVVNEVPENLAGMSAHELWRNGEGWVLTSILPYVSEITRLRLAAVVLNNVTGAGDRMSWGETSDGRFTVKSAYALITRSESPR